MKMIEIKNISKEYFNSVGFRSLVLKNINITLQQGEVVSIIAPIGSGKSTLLKIISGLEVPTIGEIKNSSDGRIIYLPSKSSSFPWLSVHDNIVFDLKNYKEKEIKKIIKLVGLEGYQSFHPHNKSLGFRFRISLGRSLANNPSAILIDESFKNMDNPTKTEIYSLIRNISKAKNITFLVATSNVTEAIIISHRIYLVKKDPAEIIAELKTSLPEDHDFISVDTELLVQNRNIILNSFNDVEPQKLHGILF
jgi:ABC-type nitrate/sulfonate/bicarbonate transport system ATPase subunit